MNFLDSDLRWNKIGTTVAGVTGQPGNTSDKLRTPRGLCIDWSNTLYIADVVNNRVQKYVRGALFGETVAGDPTGISGSASNLLNQPISVDVDLDSNLYVTDSLNYRVQLWNRGASNGITVAGITGLLFFIEVFLLYKIGVLLGSPGSTLHQLTGAYGISLDLANNVMYVGDSGDHRVTSYRISITNGTIVAGGNGLGMNNNQLYHPYGIHFDEISNSVFIANHPINNVVRWVVNASSWTLAAGDLNGTSGNTSNRLNLPLDVTLDPMGNLYVPDHSNHRIQFFYDGESNGTTIVGTTGIYGSNASLLYYPVSIAFDSQLNLYVTEYYNHRVQKFRRY